jgi:hypothetical protein
VAKKNLGCFYGVKFGNSRKAEKPNLGFALGVSERLSKTIRGNFGCQESGSLGMRRVKMANSPLFGRDLKVKLG